MKNECNNHTIRCENCEYSKNYDLQCGGDGCNIQTNKIYRCDLCDKKFCINCMYLLCPICNREYTCFWCGCKYKYNGEKDMKCKKCVL